MNTSSHAKRLPDETVILARAVVKSAAEAGEPLRDPRILEASRQPLSTEKQSA